MLWPITAAVPEQRQKEIITQFKEARAGTVLLCQLQTLTPDFINQNDCILVFCEALLEPGFVNFEGQAQGLPVYQLLATNTIDAAIRQSTQTRSPFLDLSGAGQNKWQRPSIQQLVSNEQARFAGY